MGVNAFVLPGGVVCVTSALLRKLALTKGELAALLCHEMGHVLHRHSQARILQQQMLTTICRCSPLLEYDRYFFRFCSHVIHEGTAQQRVDSSILWQEDGDDQHFLVQTILKNEFF